MFRHQFKTMTRYYSLEFSVHKVQHWYQNFIEVVCENSCVHGETNSSSGNQFEFVSYLYFEFDYFMASKFIYVDGAKIEWLNHINYHMWKCCIFHLLILDKSLRPLTKFLKVILLPKSWKTSGRRIMICQYYIA